jgi:hypothetical protein
MIEIVSLVRHIAEYLYMNDVALYYIRITLLSEQGILSYSNKNG